MKKQNHTLWGGVVRTALALALAVGLMPAQALTTMAVADEGAPQSTPAEQPEQIVAQTVKLDGAQASSSEEGAKDVDAASSSSASAEAQASDAAASASPASSSSERDEVDIVSASVSLGAKATLITCNGLSFSIDPDEQTAALVGVSNSELQGELAIPSEVASAGVSYKVAAVNNGWGGVHRILI